MNHIYKIGKEAKNKGEFRWIYIYIENLCEGIKEKERENLGECMKEREREKLRSDHEQEPHKGG